MSKKRMETVRKIADAFRRNIREAIVDEWVLLEIDQKNRSDGATCGNCETHAHRDPNIDMGEAFEEVVGREADPSDPLDRSLWVDAWGEAQRLGFSAVVQKKDFEDLKAAFRGVVEILEEVLSADSDMPSYDETFRIAEERVERARSEFFS